MLINKGIEEDLCTNSGIRTASVIRIGKDGHDDMEVFAKICAVMDFGVDDIRRTFTEGKVENWV